MNEKLNIDLGHVVGKAAMINEMFEGYERYPEDSEYGYYFRAEDWSWAGNERVSVYTNAFETEGHFNDVLFSKLLLRCK